MVCVQRLKLINSSVVLENQLQRQRHLTAACRRLGISREAPDFETSDMYINDTLRYVYCVVNKVHLPAAQVMLFGRHFGKYKFYQGGSKQK